MSLTEEEKSRITAKTWQDFLNLSLDGVTLVDMAGRFMEVNQAFCELSGYSREELLNRSIADLDVFLTPEEAVTRLEQSSQSGRIRMETVIRRKDQVLVEVEVSATFIASGEVQTALAFIRDLRSQKKKEKQDQFQTGLLNLFRLTSSRKEYLEGVLGLIKEWSGCQCAGIRILNPEGYIPYECFTGFSREFWEAENMLSLEKDQCACTRIVARTTEPQDQAILTSGGSFLSNNIENYISSLTEEGKTRFRGTCVRNGFKSVAIIPIFYRDSILGAIHLADADVGKVPLEMVQFLERTSVLIGEAVQRFTLMDRIQASEERYRSFVENSSEAIWRLDLDPPVLTALPEEQQIDSFYLHGRIMEVNQAMVRMHGYESPDELIGMNLGNIFPRLSRQNLGYLTRFIR